MDSSTLAKSFLDTVRYMADHGELMKAYMYLQNPPAYLEGRGEIVDELGRIQSRIGELAEMQNHGTVKGKFNAGFTVPEDVEKLVAFQKLKKILIEKGIKTAVDVGCFSGWMGRELSKEGIKVHGIDIHPVVIQLAALYSVGTGAVFEYLPVQQLGAKYPKQFEVAILFDVLEHCFDPELIIANIDRAATKSVYINLPHPEGEDTSPHYPLDMHEHLYAFSEKGIRELLGGKKNLNIEKINNEQGTVNWFISYDI